MLNSTIVPHQQVANAPSVPVHVLRFGHLRKQEVQQSSALSFRNVKNPCCISFANIDAFAAGDRMGPNDRVHCIPRIFVLSLVVGEARSDAEFGCLSVVHRIVAVDRAQPVNPTLHLGWKVFIGRPGTCKRRVAKRHAVALRHFQA